MLNEERIKLMTRMASYEAGEGKENVAVANHFRSDYVSLHVLKAIICATIAFMIVFGVYIFYDFENFMLDIYKMDLLEFAKKILFSYVFTVGGYCIAVYVYFSYRYNKAKKSLKRYFNNLKLLSSLYMKETKK